MAALVFALVAVVIWALALVGQTRKQKDTLTGQEKKLARLTSELDQLKKKQDILRQKAQKDSKEMLAEEQRNSDLQNELKDKNQKLESLQKKLSKLAENEKDLRKQQETQDETIKNLQHQLDTSRSQLASCQEKITKKQAVLAELQQHATEAEKGESEKAKSQSRKISQLQEMLQAKQSELEDGQKEIARLRKNEADLQAQKISAGSTIANLEKDLKDYHSKLLACQDKIKQAQSNINDLQQRIRDLEESRESAESRLQQLASTNAALVSQLKTHIEKQEVTIKQYQQKLSVTFLDRVLFGSGKVSITPEGKTVLMKVGKVLKEITGETIQVVGNTDAVPIAPEYRHRFSSNWELSAARAAAVVYFLQHKCGVDPRKMEAVGRSSYYPIASNANPEGRAKNRNVEIIIGPKLE